MEGDGGSYVAGNEGDDEGNEVLCVEGAGILIGNASLIGIGEDKDAFTSGDLVCEDGCNLVDENGNDYCDYVFPDDDDDDDDSDDDDDGSGGSSGGANAANRSFGSGSIVFGVALLAAALSCALTVFE